MAWQLIYTSAPRLLEAGRTGFGTVARHRAVSGILASTIERFSQFARLPGHDPRRLIHSHRLITVGANQYHILSCIRDSGSDYTGRTSHIAHHLIAEVREVRSLAESGVTPADVLLAMSWRTSWSESPRFLDPTEEISLSSLRSAVGQTWAAVAGSQDFVRLPYGTTAKRGCYFLLPPAADGLRLIHESLHQDPTGAWNVPFTTCLEPGDDIGDFRWMALAETSPLRPESESATRVIFDLTRPASLPTPPERAVAKEGVPIQESRAAQPVIPISHPAPPLPQVWSPEPEKRPRKKAPLLWVVLVAAMVLVAGAAGGFWILQQKKQEQADRQALEQQVDDLWARHHLKLPGTARWLKQQADLSLIKEHQVALSAMQASRAAPDVTQTVPSPTSNDLDGQFNDLIRDHLKWEEAYQAANLPNAWEKKSPVVMLNEAKPRLDAERRAWKALGEHFERSLDSPPSPGIALAERAARELQSGGQPMGTPQEWETMFKALGSLAKAPTWLRVWESAARLKTSDPESLVAELEKKTVGAPLWLTKLIAEKKDQITAAAAAGTAQPAPAPTAPELPPPQPAPVAEAADDPKGTHPIHILSLSNDADRISSLATLAELPVEEGMRIGFGIQADGLKDLKEWPFNSTQSVDGDKVYSHGKMAAKDKQIGFSGKRLSRLPEPLSNSRLIARSQDGIKLLFELWIITDPATYSLDFSAIPTFKGMESKDGTRLLGLAQFLRRFHVVGAKAAQFRLRQQTTPSTPPKLYVLELSSGEYVAMQGERKPDIDPTVIGNMNKRKAEWGAAIQADKKRIVDLSHSKEAKEQKNLKTRQYETAIAQKEAEIASIDEKLNQLTAIPDETSILPPGLYIVESSQGPVALCKIRLATSTDSPQPAPSQP